MDWHVPLLVSTVLFVALLVWRVRPRFDGASAGKTAALKAVRARIEGAKSDGERALALCEAGDVAAAGLGGSDSAIGYYLRAMRLAPHSAELVTRASRGLARKPRTLESLLWRRLGAEEWNGAGAAAARAAVEELAKLYAGPLRNAPRARALEHATKLFVA